MNSPKMPVDELKGVKKFSLPKGPVSEPRPAHLLPLDTFLTLGLPDSFPATVILRGIRFHKIEGVLKVLLGFMTYFFACVVENQ